MKRALVVLLIAGAVLAAAETWLRTGGAALASGALGTPLPIAIPSPEQPRATPLLVVGSALTVGAGLRDDERWTALLARRVVGADSFSEVLAVAPVAPPPLALLGPLQAFARTAGYRGTAAIAPHDRGSDVVVIEAGGDALGADPTPFVIEPGPRLAPAAGGGLALARAFAGWRAARDHDDHERALAELIATDGLVAGASERARRRLDALTAALRARTPTRDQVAFLRALVLELHGLARRETRERALADWQRLLGTLRMQQRGVVVVLSGAPMLTLGLESLANELTIPVVRAAAIELDPRLRLAPDGHVAAVVQAQLADQVWVALSKKQMVPEELRAPREVVDAAGRLEAAAHSRTGIDDSLAQQVRIWITNRCEFGGEPPAQALFGVGRNGRLAPGVAAEIVVARPPLADELIVHATARAGALPHLALRHALGSATLEAKVLEPVRGDPSRARLEYRVAAPTTRSAMTIPAYEYTLERAGDDPEFELTDVTITATVEDDLPR